MNRRTSCIVRPLPTVQFRCFTFGEVPAQDPVMIAGCLAGGGTVDGGWYSHDFSEHSVNLLDVGRPIGWRQAMKTTFQCVDGRSLHFRVVVLPAQRQVR
jgi:hypothetical protein